MTVRTCDGGADSGYDAQGHPCNCGHSFDDLVQSMTYPHAINSLPITTYNYGQSWWNTGGVIPPSSPPLIPWGHYPNSATLSKTEVKDLAESITTLVKPGEHVVICVDADVTDEQKTELQWSLNGAGLYGIIIRAARASTGYAYDWNASTPEEARVDVLARIGEVWSRRPDLSLCDLLEWYRGEHMDDADFATAVELHFSKVTNGIHGKP